MPPRTGPAEGTCGFADSRARCAQPLKGNGLASSRGVSCYLGRLSSRLAGYEIRASRGLARPALIQGRSYGQASHLAPRRSSATSSGELRCPVPDARPNTWPARPATTDAPRPDELSPERYAGAAPASGKGAVRQLPAVRGQRCGGRPNMKSAGPFRCPGVCHAWAATITDPAVLTSRRGRPRGGEPSASPTIPAPPG